MVFPGDCTDVNGLGYELSLAWRQSTLTVLPIRSGNLVGAIDDLRRAKAVGSRMSSGLVFSRLGLGLHSTAPLARAPAVAVRSWSDRSGLAAAKHHLRATRGWDVPDPPDRYGLHRRPHRAAQSAISLGQPTVAFALLWNTTGPACQNRNPRKIHDALQLEPNSNAPASACLGPAAVRMAEPAGRPDQIGRDPVSERFAGNRRHEEGIRCA